MTSPEQDEAWGDIPFEIPPELLGDIRTAVEANQRDRLRRELIEAQRRLDLVIQLLGDGTAYDHEDDE